MIPLAHYLILSAILFSIGLAGVLIRKNIIVVFMCLEMMLTAANVALVAFSRAQARLACLCMMHRCSHCSSPALPRQK